jgi:hypothetical protein
LVALHAQLEDAKATLVNASENPEDYILEDDYKDDVHKGKVFTDSNGVVVSLGAVCLFYDP